MFGVPFGQHSLVGRIYIFNSNFAVLPKLQRPLSPVIRAFRMMPPHIVGVHQTAGFIKSPVLRPCFRLIATMPFAKKCRFISGILKYFANGGESCFQPATAGAVCTKNFCSSGVTARNKCRTRCRTNSLWYIKITEHYSFFCQFCYVRRCNTGLPERREIGIPRIVEKDNYNIGLFGCLRIIGT